MLKKPNRLIRFTQRNYKILKTPFFSLKIAGNSLTVSRFGFLASKKINKRAVVRNRAKRVLRSLIEERLEKIKEGHDFLFVIKKEGIIVKRGELLKELEIILKKEQLYND